MSDDLPEVAVRAGAEALYYYNARPEGTREPDAAARAVLVAATERIECPARVYVFHGERRYARWRYEHPKDCAVCAGTRFLYVLKQEKT